MTKFADDKQFAYWLQGYFEIAGTTQLNDKQALQVAGAAAKVETKGALSNFVIEKLTQGSLSKSGPALVKVLHDTFKHDIDPTYSGDQNQFNDVHNGSNNGPRPGSGLRC